MLLGIFGGWHAWLVLRNRTTFWIHPERDVTAEVTAILNR